MVAGTDMGCLTNWPPQPPQTNWSLMDLGYGGARRALHNLSPKSARILSAAITRTPLPPAGVRIELPAEVRIGPPAGVRIPCDDFHSGVG